MIVTIWRHGQAGPASTDSERELTDQGCDDIGFGCHQFHVALEARGMPPVDLLLHSPWQRTVQTAEIIASAFTRATSRELVALRPGGTVEAVEAALADPASAAVRPAHVVLVSHQPLVSQLVEHFLGAAGRLPFLSPGSLATLELPVVAQACATLCFWAAPPQYQAET